MINKSRVIRTIAASVFFGGLLLVGGFFNPVAAQGRDPFTKPGWAKTRDQRATAKPAAGASSTAKKTVVGGEVAFAPPPIEQRIEFFKRLRESAAVNGQPLPKVTSVLMLSEMAVTGIFQTPRGYAAMVEATPIKLSYTIYPGEKFFDGQLVAVEENRLVFRKVTKTGRNKFIATVENKTLRKYTAQEEVQGTAPIQGNGGVSPAQTESRPPETVAPYQPQTASATAEKQALPTTIVSPVDEMNQQKPDADPAKSQKAKKPAKKTVKVARN